MAEAAGGLDPAQGPEEAPLDAARCAPDPPLASPLGRFLVAVDLVWFPNLHLHRLLFVRVLVADGWSSSL